MTHKCLTPSEHPQGLVCEICVPSNEYQQPRTVIKVMEKWCATQQGVSAEQKQWIATKMTSFAHELLEATRYQVRLGGIMRTNADQVIRDIIENL